MTIIKDVHVIAKSPVPTIIDTCDLSPRMTTSLSNSKPEQGHGYEPTSITRANLKWAACGRDCFQVAGLATSGTSYCDACRVPAEGEFLLIIILFRYWWMVHVQGTIQVNRRCQFR